MTCELEPTGESVKLTIIHEMEKPDSRFIEIVSKGWPLIRASLKSLLENRRVARRDPHLAERDVKRKKRGQRPGEVAGPVDGSGGWEWGYVERAWGKARVVRCEYQKHGACQSRHGNGPNGATQVRQRRSIRKG